MCYALNMSEFVGFRKHGRVLNIRRDTIMKGFRIFWYSEYARFLRMQALHRVLNIPEYG